MVVTLQGNPAKRGVRVMSNPDMYLSLVMTGARLCRLLPQGRKNLSPIRGCPLRGDGESKDFCINICLCQEKVLPLHP